MSEQPPVDLDVIRARRTRMELTYGDVAALLAEVERLRAEAAADAAERATAQDTIEDLTAEVQRLRQEVADWERVHTDLRQRVTDLAGAVERLRAELTAVRIDRDEWRERAQTLHRTVHDGEAGE